jgi:hypothetical protein
MYILAKAQQFASSVASTAQKIQHYRVTLEAAKQHYQLGLLTATGLVYYAIAIQRSPGWKIKLDPQTVEEQLGIKKTAFYSAISKLREEGLIEWEARTGINAWIPVSNHEVAPQDEIIPSCDTAPVDEAAFGCDDLSQDSDCQQDEVSANAERVRIRGMVSAIAEPEPLEALQDEPPPSLTDTQYIFNQQQNSAVVAEKGFREKPQPQSLVTESQSQSSIEEEPHLQPTVEEKREVLNELRQMGMKLNWTVQHTIANYFANVIEAIAHIKERVQSGETFRCLEAAFVKACKEGARPERSRQKLKQYPLPNSEQKALLQQAKWKGLIADYYLAPFDGGETIAVDDWTNHQVIPWWQYLDINLPLANPAG